MIETLHCWEARSGPLITGYMCKTRGIEIDKDRGKEHPRHSRLSNREQNLHAVSSLRSTSSDEAWSRSSGRIDLQIESQRWLRPGSSSSKIFSSERSNVVESDKMIHPTRMSCTIHTHRQSETTSNTTTMFTLFKQSVSPRALAAETLGTFLLVFIGCGTVVSTQATTTFHPDSSSRQRLSPILRLCRHNSRIRNGTHQWWTRQSGCFFCYLVAW